MRRTTKLTVVQIVTVTWMLLLVWLLDKPSWEEEIKNIVTFVLGGMAVLCVVLLQFVKAVYSVDDITDKEIEQFHKYISNEPPDEGRRR